jgi:hypothetical protein
MPNWSGEARGFDTGVKSRPPIPWSRLSQYEGSYPVVDRANSAEGRWPSPVTVGLPHVTTRPDVRHGALGGDRGGSLIERATGRSDEPRALR